MLSCALLNICDPVLCACNTKRVHRIQCLQQRGHLSIPRDPCTMGRTAKKFLFQYWYLSSTSIQLRHLLTAFSTSNTCTEDLCCMWSTTHQRRVNMYAWGSPNLNWSWQETACVRVMMRCAAHAGGLCNTRAVRGRARIMVSRKHLGSH